MSSPLTLSVLDLATVASGSSAADALHRTVALAQHVEALGYNRFWVAEHHNMPMIASSAPDILIAEVAAATKTIRVGAGGVMLPNHAPLAVAERYATLEAFHPGRIDLGIGRAPGSDGRTAQALRRSMDGPGGGGFLREFAEMRAFFADAMPAGHPFHGIRAMPGPGYEPPLWFLGSSTFSAQVAAELGQRFAFAYHFAPGDVAAAMRMYRKGFKPSDDLAEPHAMLTVGVVIGETDAEAQRMATSGALAFARLRLGGGAPLPSPAEVEIHEWTPDERYIAEDRLSTQVIGTAERVLDELRSLAERYQADEIMIAGMVHDAEAHRRGFDLLANAAGLRTN